MNITSAGRRIISTLIDCFIIFVLSVAINRTIPVIGWLISLSFGFLYYPAFWSSRAQASVGKYLIGCTVVDKNGDRISFRTAMIRYLFSWVSGVFLGFGYIMGIFEKNHQTFHDMLAGTFVVDNKIELEEGLFQAWLDQIKTLRK